MLDSLNTNLTWKQVGHGSGDSLSVYISIEKVREVCIIITPGSHSNNLSIYFPVLFFWAGAYRNIGTSRINADNTAETVYAEFGTQTTNDGTHVTITLQRCLVGSTDIKNTVTDFWVFAR